MNYHDFDSLRLLTREHHDQRLREAGAERLARDIRAGRRRRGLRLTVTLALGATQRLRLGRKAAETV